ncbi:MAG: geranylgeranyl diphosphate synthase, type [Actinomycetota bacterium]|jgi:geranylgeranyl diphosphate synthase type I|nr:geranylgeranyl diphosphate synthase, type [Actinomycetota bacterium]
MSQDPILELRVRIDQILQEFLAQRRRASPEAAPLIDEIERVVNAGGKRLRPAFCYWGYRAAGGTNEEAISRCAASLELLHTFAVVHDDIMDASEQRRGEPAVHVQQGQSVAILVGDLALVLADDLFMTSGFDAEDMARAFTVYSEMRQQVIAGQFLDVMAAEQVFITQEHARLIATMKSGGYSVEKPLMLGATLARGSRDLVDALCAFGGPLGEAFQLRDDLLGVFGDPANVGKPVGADIREGKRNLLFVKTVESLGPQERADFASRWGSDSLSVEDVDELRNIVDVSGARAATEALIEDLRADATEALFRAPIDEDPRVSLRALASAAIDRID